MFCTSSGASSDSGRGFWKVNRDLKPTTWVIAGHDGATVDLDRAVGDGEAEAGAAGRALKQEERPDQASNSSSFSMTSRAV